jgi:hypothetical protein
MLFTAVEPIEAGEIRKQIRIPHELAGKLATVLRESQADKEKFVRTFMIRLHHRPYSLNIGARSSGGTRTSRTRCVLPWEIAASPSAASTLRTQSEIVPNIDTTYCSPATDGITTASCRSRPDRRSRTCRATHDRGGNPRRAHQQKNDPVPQPSRAPVAIEEAIERTALRRIALGEAIQRHFVLRCHADLSVCLV